MFSEKSNFNSQNTILTTLKWLLKCGPQFSNALKNTLFQKNKNKKYPFPTEVVIIRSFP